MKEKLREASHLKNNTDVELRPFRFKKGMLGEIGILSNMQEGKEGGSL